METKQLRENRNMRITTIATAALLVVLAGTGFASAAVVELSIVLDTPSLLAGESTTYTVYGVAKDNITDDTFGVTLNGGISQYMIDQSYVGAGSVKHLRAGGPPTVFNAATVSLAPFTAAKSMGSLLPASGVDPGTAGIDNTFGGQPNPGKFDYYSDPFTAPFEIGNELTGPMALYTGTLIALADGIVDIQVASEPGQTLVWQLDSSGMKTAVPASVVGGSAILTIGDVSANEVPTVALPDGNVLEEEWTREPGWNNPAHSVTVTAVGADGDDGPSALTYQWTLTQSAELGGASEVLSETGAVLNLTIGDITLGLPPLIGSVDPSYNWTLSVTAFDGTDTSAPAQVGIFVPEPTTMGLLGFGIVALLKRRRRA